MSNPTIAELLAGKGNAYLRAEASPDGRHAIMIEEDEVSNGHWVARAALYTMPDEELVAPIGIDSWSTGRVTWAADGGSVFVELWRYPGDVPGVAVEIDLNRRSTRIAGGTELPLTRLTAALEANYFSRGGRG